MDFRGLGLLQGLVEVSIVPEAGIGVGLGIFEELYVIFGEFFVFFGVFYADALIEFLGVFGLKDLGEALIKSSGILFELLGFGDFEAKFFIDFVADAGVHHIEVLRREGGDVSVLFDEHVVAGLLEALEGEHVAVELLDIAKLLEVASVLSDDALEDGGSETIDEEVDFLKVGVGGVGDNILSFDH